MSELSLTLPPSVTRFPEPIEAVYLNPGKSFDKTAFLITLSSGFTPLFLVVEESNAQDALDTYADSPHATFSKVSADDMADYETGEVSDEGHKEYRVAYLGNHSDPHDLDNVDIREINFSAMFGQILIHETAYRDIEEGDYVDPQRDSWSVKIESFYDLEKMIDDMGPAEPSSSEFTDHMWYTNPQANSGTAEYISSGLIREHSYHLKGFDPQIERWLYDRIKGIEK